MYFKSLEVVSPEFETSIFNVGDSVFFHSDGPSPYVADIESFYENTVTGSKFVQARWFYRAADILALSPRALDDINYDNKIELFYSNDLDENLVCSILRPCVIVLMNSDEEAPFGPRSAPRDAFYCRYRFLLKSGKVSVSKLNVSDLAEKVLTDEIPSSQASIDDSSSSTTADETVVFEEELLKKTKLKSNEKKIESQLAEEEQRRSSRFKNAPIPDFDFDQFDIQPITRIRKQKEKDVFLSNQQDFSPIRGNDDVKQTSRRRGRPNKLIEKEPPDESLVRGEDFNLEKMESTVESQYPDHSNLSSTPHDDYASFSAVIPLSLASPSSPSPLLEMDDDIYDDDDALKFLQRGKDSVRVGSEYQADIPEMIVAHDENEILVDNISWDPKSLQCDLHDYLEAAHHCIVKMKNKFSPSGCKFVTGNYVMLKSSASSLVFDVLHSW